MTRALKMPPVRLKASIIIPLVRIATTKLRTITINRISLKPRNAIPIIVIIFPNPSFTPGIGTGMGINDSRNEIKIAFVTKIIINAYFLFL